MTYSEEGATGKSTYLRLLRSLPNPDAVASVPPGKFGDEKYAWRLIGRVLNAADELPDRAVRSDVFKRMITGEPVPARDVYRSATDFSPVALHVFSTNVLPALSGGVDGGTVRRLLPLEFTHVVPEAERDPDLPDRILSEEADLFLHFAVEGACRLVHNRDFTVPASSRELLSRWVLSADPVRAWAATRLEVTAEENTISVAVMFADFRNWVEAQGLKAEFLPSVIAFGKRLRSSSAGARISPFGRLRLPKCSDLREVTTMATRTWASVASRVPIPRKVRADLSTCPRPAESGQVDKLPSTIDEHGLANPPHWWRWRLPAPLAAQEDRTASRLSSLRAWTTGAPDSMNAPQSSSMTARSRAPGPRASRGSIPIARLSTCRCGAGNALSTISAGSSVPAGRRRPRRSIGGRWTCSAAIGKGLSPGSTAPGSCGCSMAIGSSSLTGIGQ